MVNLIWRLSGNLIYYVFSIEPQTNYTISPYYMEEIQFFQREFNGRPRKFIFFEEEQYRIILFI